MKKGFAFIGTAVIFIFGTIIHYSYILSDGAVWSLLISSVNSCAWETLKPFAIVYIMWVIIELSVLRPSLLRFVCIKILMLYMFATMTLIYCMCVNIFLIFDFSEYIILGGILIFIFYTQNLSYKIYNSKKKIEIFVVPIFIALILFIIMILFFSVYPPPFTVFRDLKTNTFGF